MKPPTEPPRKKGIRRIVLGTLAVGFGLVLVAMLAVVVAVFIQFRRNDRPIVLPTPRGPHPVGRMLMDWTDSRRNREIMVFLWYPAPAGASGDQCEYIPGTWGELEAEKMLPIPAQRYREIQASAIADAPLASGAMPVLVLLPGMGRIPAHYTTLAEDLASYGYAVVGVTPTGSSSVVVFSDGHMVHGREFDPDADGPIKTQETVETWSRDASFVLDQLGVDSHFANHIDLNRVGIFGHSFGGSVAVQALQRDARFSRAAILDSGFFGQPIKSLDRPLAILAADRQLEPEWKALCESNQTNCTTHLFPQARHMNFSDAAVLPSRFPLPKSILMLGDVDGEQCLREVSDILRDFFDQM
jgi:pimeloyl-ACP methyl ester carboxylesterase